MCCGDPEAGTWTPCPTETLPEVGWGSWATGLEEAGGGVCRGSEQMAAPGVMDQKWWYPLLATLKFQRGRPKQEEMSQLRFKFQNSALG